MKAVLCPVCWGKGKLDIADGKGVKQNGTVCWGCNGKGWVEVEEDYGYYPYYPYPYHPYYPWYEPYRIVYSPNTTTIYPNTTTGSPDTGTV